MNSQPPSEGVVQSAHSDNANFRHKRSDDPALDSEENHLQAENRSFTKKLNSLTTNNFHTF